MQSPLSEQRQLFRAARSFVVKLASTPDVQVAHQLDLMWAAEAVRNTPLPVAA